MLKSRKSPYSRALRLVLLVVLVLTALLIAGAAPPPAPSAAKPKIPPSPGWKQVNIVYESDIDGKVGPCG